MQASLSNADSFKEQGQPCSFSFLVTFHFAGEALAKVTIAPHDKPAMVLSHPHPKTLKIREWFNAYLQKKPFPFPLPLQLSHLSLFSQRVLTSLQTVPFGETISYKELASKAKSPSASRAVGGVCNANPYPLIIPCHRVIQSNGKIGGFAYGYEMKEQLLAHESFHSDGIDS
ncbi:MAG: Bifunctional transcriptional activator/DNA repair enzyme Ada [Chlamydiae bacterium]|nr:Bifunctional transcriptional activator/DNA repair enzyme Ada [Chlamydiota bacterium]